MGFGQETKSIRSPVVFVVTLEVSEKGGITPAWREAIRGRHGDEALAKIGAGTRSLSQEEAQWAGLIKGKVPAWPSLVDSLSIPFQYLTLPDTIAVLLGNQGGEDAFTYSVATICFDLNKLHAYYGPAAASANSGRIDRFFAHELTHLLHKAWRQKKGLQLASPFDYALWECLTEGLGNYRSLSRRWLAENGELTAHAREVLQRLQPEFVERMAALQRAPAEQAGLLMEGLSSGPFDQKWGALTVALWLAQEARGDDGNLRQWVEAGPAGVLILAHKYLPENLSEKMPSRGEGKPH